MHPINYVQDYDSLLYCTLYQVYQTMTRLADVLLLIKLNIALSIVITINATQNKCRLMKLRNMHTQSYLLRELDGFYLYKSCVHCFHVAAMRAKRNSTRTCLLNMLRNDVI